MSAVGILVWATILVGALAVFTIDALERTHR